MSNGIIKGEAVIKVEQFFVDLNYFEDKYFHGYNIKSLSAMDILSIVNDKYPEYNFYNSKISWYGSYEYNELSDLTVLTFTLISDTDGEIRRLKVTELK